MAPRWAAATAVAILAAVATSAGDLGVMVWELLISVGLLAEPVCSDATGGPLGAGVCARPTTLTVTSAVTVLLAGALAGLVVFALLARPEFQPPAGADVTES
jgi:hypothetical protein